MKSRRRGNVLRADWQSARFCCANSKRSLITLRAAWQTSPPGRDEAMDARLAIRWVLLSGLLLPATIARCAEPGETRKAIELDAAKLDAVVGQYRLGPKVVLSISRFRNRLFARTTGWHPYAIFPESETVFFYHDADAQITAERDAQGKVTAVRYDAGTAHLTGKRISDVPYDPAEAPELLDSPRLAALVKQIDGGDAHALERFWNEVQDHAPLVEPFAGDPRSSWVTFLFHGDATTRSVTTFGGPWAISTDGRGMNLVRLRDADVWYRSVRVPNDARIVYDFEVNLACRLPDEPAAERKLYDANACPDALNANFIGGTVTHHKINSEVLKQARTYALYTPPGYDEKAEALPLVVMFDGSSYHNDGYVPGPTIIDNLIAARKIPPIVAAFVDQIDRQKDLACSKDFAAFLAAELVPHVRAERHVSADPRRTTVGGLSLGGLMASYCALNHPDVFGNVISQSGAYWYFPGCFEPPTVMTTPGGVLTDEYVKRPKVPVRFYLDAGTFENDLPGDLLGENRRFRDVLRAKGYDVTYAEFSGGHHFVSWRGTFSDGLVAVTR